MKIKLLLILLISGCANSSQQIESRNLTHVTNDDKQQFSKDESHPYEGAWDIIYQTDYGMHEGIIAIWQVDNGFNVIISEDPRRVSSPPTHFGCLAKFGTSGEIFCKENDTGDVILSIGLIGGRYCKNPTDYGTSTTSDGIIKDTNLLKHLGYKNYICYMMYIPKGPGEGSGTAGNTGGD